MNQMILISATTTKAFFGEPILLGEVLKDLVSQALRIDRSSLKFEHKRTSDSEAPDIAVFVDSLGDDAIGQQIVDALSEQFTFGQHRVAMKLSISFSGEINAGLFTPADNLSVPTNQVVEDAHRASNGTEFHSYDDRLDEALEGWEWRVGW